MKRAFMDIELEAVGSQPKEEKGPRQRNGRAISRKMKQQRLMNKNGRIHVNYVNVPNRGQLYYLHDHFTTMIEAQWRYVFLIFSLAFLVSWLVFGSIWWGINSYRSNMCIEKVNSWTAAFLFSLETQTTIGYGGRQITPDCPEGVICLIIQCIIGLLISSTMLGLIFAKVSRPHKRSSTIIFSRHAVIAARNGKLYLMFRIADLRKRQLIESHIRVFLIRPYVTQEGENICSFRQPLSVKCDGESENEESVFLFSPVIVSHEINEESPFYDYSPNDLLFADFEIVVLLEGIVESTGMTMQARTSYLREEIHWGHLFVDMMGSVSKGYYSIDVSRLHETFPVALPRISAREFHDSRLRENGNDNSQQQELMEEISDRDKTDTPQSNYVRSGVTLVPNGEVGQDVNVSKL